MVNIQELIKKYEEEGPILTQSECKCTCCVNKSLCARNLCKCSEGESSQEEEDQSQESGDNDEVVTEEQDGQSDPGKKKSFFKKLCKNKKN